MPCEPSEDRSPPNCDIRSDPQRPLSVDSSRPECANTSYSFRLGERVRSTLCCPSRWAYYRAESERKRSSVRRWALRNLTVSGRLVAAPPVSATPGISMFDDPSGAGTAIFRSPLSGIVPAALPGFVIAIPVRDEEERLPAVCALSRDSATGRADRFRRRRSALSYSPTIAAIGVQASPGNSAEVYRSTSTLSKLDCLRRSRTPAPLAARRWTLQKRGLWKPARATA